MNESEIQQAAAEALKSGEDSAFRARVNTMAAAAMRDPNTNIKSVSIHTSPKSATVRITTKDGEVFVTGAEIKNGNIVNVNR